MHCRIMAARRQELRVAPIVGRQYATVDARAQFVDVVEEYGATVRPVSFNAAFRGCCYNQFTKTLLICDPIDCCVRTYDVEIDSDSEFIVTTRGQIGDRGSGAGKFMCPVALDVNNRGELAVVDFKLNRVSFFTGSGNALHYFGKTGSGRGEFRGLTDIKFTLLGHVAVVDSENHRVQIMTATGGLVTSIGGAGWRRGHFSSPCALDIARNGDIFVCDAGNKRVQRFNAKGKFIAAWGSQRDHHARSTTSAQYDANGFPITTPGFKTIFDSPCDLILGVHGEIVVCDAGRQELLVFNDVGNCLHVHQMPKQSLWSPIAMCICRNSMIVVTRAQPPPETSRTGSMPVIAPIDQATAHKLVVYPPASRVPTGRLALWTWQTLLNMISHLTYAEALKIRLVNRTCHRACRILRNEWRLYPLTPGSATILKYNKVVRQATGRAAAVEAFEKWGLRIFKPANRIRRHVMDFDSGFRNAVSTLFGPMFFFQHEAILHEVFRFHGARDKQEIDQPAFLEIVTVIEEVRAGLLTWRQCDALRHAGHIPPIRDLTTIPGDTKRPLLGALQLVETAQQHQLTKLLTKLQHM